MPAATATSWAEDRLALEEVAGIVFGDVPMNSLMATDSMTEELGLQPHLILLAVDGHTCIAVDYQKGDVPKVTCTDIECDTEHLLEHAGL